MIDNFIPAEIRVNVIKAFEETTSLRDQLCNFQEMQTEMIDVALTELEKKGLDTTIWVYDSKTGAPRIKALAEISTQQGVVQPTLDQFVHMIQTDKGDNTRDVQYLAIEE